MVNAEELLLGYLADRAGLAECILLSNERVLVKLHSERPIVLSYRALGSGDLLLGDPAGQEPVFTVYSEREKATWSSEGAGAEVTYSVRREGTTVTYHARVARDGTLAMEVDLGFTLCGDDLTVSFANCVEHPGFQFMHVDLNRLVSSHSLLRGSRLVIGTHAGRLINPETCGEGEYFHKYGWIRDAFSTVGLVHGPHLTAVLMLESLEDTVLSSVKQNEGGRFAGLGVQFRYRYPSSIPSAQFAPRASSRIRLHLSDAATGAPERGWVVGARYLHGLHTDPLPDPYRDTFIYKVFLGCPGALKETTFDQALDLIRDIHHLTDGAKQVAYLVGFQHDGHDTSYPDVFAVNPHAGGLDRLLNLVREAEKLNANVSFHDNYDDAYQSSPAWDPDDISVNLEGELLRGGVWNGEQAFWNSMPVYMRNKAPERIRRTLQQYPIRQTYHLDVLTASVFRVDYRPSEPTGKDADWRARIALVAEFRKHGIDVTSEGCGLPFIDHIRYFWNLPRTPEQVYPGDRRIPFGPFIAHGHVNYGGSHADSWWWILDGLLYGAHYSQDLRANTPRKEIADAYYLLQVALNLLRADAMVDFAEDGPRKRVTYSDGSFVEVDFESLEHEVNFRGARIVKDFVSFAPGNRGGTYLYYRARHGRELVWALPEAWRSAKALTGVALTTSGEGERREIEVRDGMVTFNLPEGVPFRITRA